MEKDILMLDDKGIEEAAFYMGLSLGCDVNLALTIQDAKQHIDSTNSYGVFLVEPFGRINEKSGLQALMIDARENRQIPVVVYSTQSESDLKRDFELEFGIHYDSYVGKMGRVSSAEKLKRTLDRYLCQ